MVVILLYGSVDTPAYPDKEDRGKHIDYVRCEEVPCLAQTRLIEVFSTLINYFIENYLQYCRNSEDNERRINCYSHGLSNLFVVVYIMGRLFNKKVAYLEQDY